MQKFQLCKFLLLNFLHFIDTFKEFNLDQS